MKHLIATALALTICNAATAQQMGYGEAEYLNSCAVCHGTRRQGRRSFGRRADEASRRLDAAIRDENGGEFPYARVFAVIDGRYVVPGHGERDMPVWGRQFLEDDAKVYGPSGGEIVTTERIHNLAGYVESLQR